MTQAALGHAVGVKNVYISQLENNVHEASRPLMRTIAQTLGVSIGFLELETDDPTPPQIDEPEQPNYLSPQADEAAQLIDAMNDNEWRDLALQMVQLLAMHAGADSPGEDAPAPPQGGFLLPLAMIMNYHKMLNCPLTFIKLCAILSLVRQQTELTRGTR